MTRWNGFSRTVLFAALAAAGVTPWLVLAGPILGGSRSLAIYLVAAAALYLGGLAGGLRRRVATVAAAAVVGCGIALLSRSITEEVLGLAFLVATARSAFLYRAPVSRAVVTELALTGTGLLFARFLSGPSLAGTILPIWGFFLVQGFYFLIGGIERRREAGHPDPFEEACRRATALLDTP